MDARWLALLAPAAALVAGRTIRGGSRLKTTKRRVRPSYRITFEKRDPDTLDEERGWIQPGGYELTAPADLYGDAYDKFIAEAGGVDHYLDEENSWDPEEGHGVVETMAKVLKWAGATEPSSHPFTPGSSWSTGSEQDFRTGEYKTKSYHLHNLTVDEEVAVAKAMGVPVDKRFLGSKNKKRSVESRQDEAIKTYGEAWNPDSVGFILSDGRWVDFSEGSGGIRTQDHRNVGHLLADDERFLDHEYASSTKNMNRWMDLAHAIRVSRSGRHGEAYVLLDLPDDPRALKAVLSSTLVRRSLSKYLRGASAVTLGLPEGKRREVDLWGPGALIEVFDELLEALPELGSLLRTVSRKAVEVAPLRYIIDFRVDKITGRWIYVAWEATSDGKQRMRRVAQRRDRKAIEESVRFDAGDRHYTWEVRSKGLVISKGDGNVP